MKLERNLFFQGHGKIYLFFSTGVGKEDWVVVGKGEREEAGSETGQRFYNDGGFAQCSQIDKQGHGWGGGQFKVCCRCERKGGDRIEETVCLVMSK